VQVIVHGGAGDESDEPARRQAVLDDAAAAGAGATGVLDAVTAAVEVLEADARFNAGRGGAIQSDGRVRTDAGVMTSDRAVGAVAGLDGVTHAARVARLVLEETPHVLLAGDPAVDFARAHDVAVEDLTTDATRARFAEADPPGGDAREHLAWVLERFGVDHDTVGAVATDGEAFAAATSTAGRWFALAGRVGDVPQVGAGFYCSPAGGASATGAGEDIARSLLARRAVGHLERGADAATAAERAIDEFADLTDSRAGVIVRGPDGSGRAFNTEAMQTAEAER